MRCKSTTVSGAAPVGNGSLSIRIASSNALLAIIPFDEKHNLPSLIEDYQKHPTRAINLILRARPVQ